MGHFKLVWVKSKKDIAREHKKSVEKNLSKWQASGCVVWCRNGRVVPTATPCSVTSCELKTFRQDVKEGLLTCRQFQLTERPEASEKADGVSDWFISRNVAEFGVIPRFVETAKGV